MGLLHETSLRSYSKKFKMKWYVLLIGALLVSFCVQDVNCQADDDDNDGIPDEDDPDDDNDGIPDEDEDDDDDEGELIIQPQIYQHFSTIDYNRINARYFQT